MRRTSHASCTQIELSQRVFELRKLNLFSRRGFQLGGVCRNSNGSSMTYT